MPKSSMLAALLVLATAAPLAAQRTTVNFPSEATPADAGKANLLPETLSLATDPSQRMTVMVDIGGKGPFPFLVDTGSERTAISRELASQLRLRGGVPVRVHSVLGTETVQTVHIPRLGVGTRALSVSDAPTFEAQHIGAAGMLGIDSLHAQRVMFDFKAKEMRILPSRIERDEVVNKDTIVVRARSRKGRLVLTSVTLDGIRIAAVIDTGAQISIGNPALLRRLQRARHIAIQRNPVAKKDARATIEAVTGHAQRVDLLRVRRLDLGGVKLDEVTIAFASARIFEELGFGSKPALLLGMDAMRSFDTVSIDFAQKKVRFVVPSVATRRFVRMAAR